jgi:hypothetical protein
MNHVANASEAEDHHRPGGGFGDGGNREAFGKGDSISGFETAMFVTLALKERAGLLSRYDQSL